MNQFIKKLSNENDLNRILCQIEPSNVHFLSSQVCLTPCQKPVCLKCIEKFYLFIGEYIHDGCTYECILCEKKHIKGIAYNSAENYFENLKIEFNSVYRSILHKIKSTQLDIRGKIFVYYYLKLNIS